MRPITVDTSTEYKYLIQHYKYLITTLKQVPGIGGRGVRVDHSSGGTEWGMEIY